MKKKLLYLCIVIVVFTIVAIVAELATKNVPIIEEELSFYYQDSLLVSNVAESEKVVDCSEGIIIRDGWISVRDPKNFTIEDLHQYIVVKDADGEEREIPVSIRCWINGAYELEEIDPRRDGIVTRNINRTWKKIKELTGWMQYEALLLTQDDTSYIARNNRIYWQTAVDEGIICDHFKLNCPEYNQLVKKGDVAYLRSGESIYFSKDNMKIWKCIYCHKRAVSVSLYLCDNDSSLVFCEYTAGTIRERHYILKYNIATEAIDTLHTFYTRKEFEEQGLAPCCRHHHVLTKDPYTGYAFLGTGDSDIESSIYYSSDNCLTLNKIGGGDQTWRTLALFFNANWIMWGTDSGAPQYLSVINRKDLDSCLIDTNRVNRYPLLHGALWRSEKLKDKDFWVLASNNEGSYYNDRHYVFGVTINEDGSPNIYNILCQKSIDFPYHQLYVLGEDSRGVLWFYDTRLRHIRKFRLAEI